MNQKFLSLRRKTLFKFLMTLFQWQTSQMLQSELQMFGPNRNLLGLKYRVTSRFKKNQHVSSPLCIELWCMQALHHMHKIKLINFIYVFLPQRVRPRPLLQISHSKKYLIRQEQVIICCHLFLNILLFEIIYKFKITLNYRENIKAYNLCSFIYRRSLINKQL